MIIHECNAIFIHIPKTAGVSICHSIMSHLTGENTSGEIGHLSNKLKIQFNIRNPQKHKQAQYYSPTDITQELWDSYYKFSIVRNPWDRVVSEFHWRHSLPTRHPSIDFKKFLRYCESRINDTTNSKRDIYWTHAQTQKSYVANNNGKLILDDIFRFEELDLAMKIISKKLHIPLELGMYNTSNHKNYRNYYDDESKDIIENLYKEDIEIFNYEF